MNTPIETPTLTEKDQLLENMIAEIIEGLPVIGPNRMTPADHETLAAAFKKLINKGLSFDSLLDKTELRQGRFAHIRMDAVLPYNKLSDDEAEALKYCENILQSIPRSAENGGARRFDATQTGAAVICSRLYKRTMLTGYNAKVTEKSSITGGHISTMNTEHMGIDIRDILPEAFPKLDTDNEVTDETVQSTMNGSHADILATAGVDQTTSTNGHEFAVTPSVSSQPAESTANTEITKGLQEQISTTQQQVAELINLLGSATGTERADIAEQMGELNELMKQVFTQATEDANRIEALESQVQGQGKEIADIKRDYQETREHLQQLLKSGNIPAVASVPTPAAQQVIAPQSANGQMEVRIPGGVTILIHHPTV